MPFINADRIKETTITTGTGAITLAGAVSGFRAFYPTLSVGDTFKYFIVSTSGTEWESGLGTLTASSTLERTTVQSSSNVNPLTAVNFSAGLKEVGIGPTAGGETPWNPVTNTLDISVNALNDVAITSPTVNQVLKYSGTEWTNQADAVNVGTVTIVSVVAANGFGGTVATDTTTPAITLTTSITGLLKGNASALLAAVAGTDYVTPTGSAANLTNFPTLNQSTTGNAATVTTNANLTGHITSTGNAAVLGSFTSAQLATALTDETGTGANVFATSPTLITPLSNTLSAIPVASGAGNSLTIAAGSGVTSGAGGSLILQAGLQANGGLDGKVIVRQVSGQTSNLQEWQTSASGGTLKTFINNGGLAYLPSGSLFYNQLTLASNGLYKGILVEDMAADGRIKLRHSDSGSAIEFWHSNTAIQLVGCAGNNMYLAGLTRIGTAGDGGGSQATLTYSDGITPQGRSYFYGRTYASSTNHPIVNYSYNGYEFNTSVNASWNGGQTGGGYGSLSFGAIGHAWYFAAALSSVKPLIVKGAASQTANLQEWQDSAGTVLASVSAAGSIASNTLSAIPIVSGLTATNLTASSSGTEIIYTGTNLTFTVGRTVSVTGLSPSTYNISGLTITSATALEFRVASTVAAGSSTGTGTATAGGNTLADAASNAVTAGPGGNRVIAAGSGAGIGKGGDIILQAGKQGDSGGDGKVIVKQVAGQTSNYFELQTSGGLLAASIEKKSALLLINRDSTYAAPTFMALQPSTSGENHRIILGANNGNMGLDIMGGALNGGTSLATSNIAPTYASFNPDGRVGIALSNPSARFHVVGRFNGNGLDTKIMIVQAGSATQANNLQEWQDSAGTVLASVSAAGVVKTIVLTVGTLPAAATAGAGARAFVSDATLTTFATVPIGGGANGVPVYSDGTDWRIG